MAAEEGISSNHKYLPTNNALQINPDIAFQKKPKSPYFIGERYKLAMTA
jgi:hypothetical protein